MNLRLLRTSSCNNYYTPALISKALNAGVANITHITEWVKRLKSDLKTEWTKMKPRARSRKRANLPIPLYREEFT